MVHDDDGAGADGSVFLHTLSLADRHCRVCVDASGRAAVDLPSISPPTTVKLVPERAAANATQLAVRASAALGEGGGWASKRRNAGQDQIQIATCGTLGWKTPVSEK
jgi:hypothetical protein